MDPDRETIETNLEDALWTYDAAKTTSEAVAAITNAIVAAEQLTAWCRQRLNALEEWKKVLR